MLTHPRALLASVLVLTCFGAQAQYQQPPEPLLGVMRAQLPPSPSLSPDGKTLLLVQQGQYPSIAQVAEPYLKLAGVCTSCGALSQACRCAD